MKLFKLVWRRHRHRGLPGWATEKTVETTMVHREDEILIAQSRSHQWAQTNTSLLTTIRTGLQRLGTPATDKPESMSWHVVSGEQVTVGDTVIVDLGSSAQGTIEDADPEYHLPLVRIGGGSHQGQLIRLTPGQIMRRRRP